MTAGEFTPEQFADVARVLQGTGGKTQEAAYLVLVEGFTLGEASRAIVVDRGAISRLCKRMRELAAIGCPACGRALIEASHGD